jgi:hypothetical protein
MTSRETWTANVRSGVFLGQVPSGMRVALVTLAMSGFLHACSNDGPQTRGAENAVVEQTPSSPAERSPDVRAPATATSTPSPTTTPQASCSAGPATATGTEHLEPTSTPTPPEPTTIPTVARPQTATPGPPAVGPPPQVEFPGCEDVAAESHYCLTLAGGEITMIGLDSGQSCPVTATDAPITDFPLVSGSIAWLDDDLYVCGEGGLIRISLRDGTWEAGGRPCDAVARYHDGLLVNRWLASVIDPEGGSGFSPPLAWYPDFQAVLSDAAERTFSLGSFSETVTVQGEKLYTAWHAGISIGVGDLSNDEDLGVLTLEDYDGWMLGMSVTDDGYLVLSGDPWGAVVYVFDAYDGRLVKKLDAFASGLACVANGTITPHDTPIPTPTPTPNTAVEPTPTPCDTWLDCPDPCAGLESDASPFELYELPPSIPIEMNCLGGGYGSSNYAVPEELLAPEATEELHVIGVYEGRGNPGFRPNAQAVVDVTVHERPKPIVLALNSYEGMLWRITLDPGARLSRVILQGYYPQEVDGVPAGVPVIVRPPEEACGIAYGWEVAQNSGGGGYGPMMASLRRFTGLVETSFQGCYAGDRFEVPYWSGDPPTGRPTPVPGNEDLPREEVAFPACAEVTEESGYCLTMTSGGVSVVGLDSGRLCPIVAAGIPFIPGLDSSLSWRGEIVYTCSYGGGLTRISLLDGSWQAMQVSCNTIADHDGGFLVSDLFGGLRFYPSLTHLLDGEWTASYSSGGLFSRVAAGTNLLYSAPWYPTDRIGVEDLLWGGALPDIVLEDFNDPIAGMAVTAPDELVVARSGLLQGDPARNDLVFFDVQTGEQVRRVPVAGEIGGLACVAPRGNGG